MKNQALEETLKKAQDQAQVRHEKIRDGVIRLVPEEEPLPESETRDRLAVLEEQVSR
mgnify:CR=1 FL=1